MEIPTRHLRRRGKVAPGEFMDEQEQEGLIEKFSRQAQAQSQLYRSIFAIVLAIPSPAFILASHCRAYPKLAFLSLVALATSVYTVRSTASRASLLRKLNCALSTLIALQAWLRLRHGTIDTVDSIWLVPLFGAVTSLVLARWLEQVQAEIVRLSKAKYALRGA